jgi:Glycosyl hydrolase family 36 C-terminal domain
MGDPAQPPLKPGSAAWQYLAADGSEVVLPGWWGPDQCGTRLFRPRLAGLDPAACHQDLDTGQEQRGATLTGAGLDLRAGADFGSTLIRLRRR